MYYYYYSTQKDIIVCLQPRKSMRTVSLGFRYPRSNTHHKVGPVDPVAPVQTLLTCHRQKQRSQSTSEEYKAIEILHIICLKYHKYIPQFFPAFICLVQRSLVLCSEWVLKLQMRLCPECEILVFR